MVANGSYPASNCSFRLLLEPDQGQLYNILLLLCFSEKKIVLFKQNVKSIKAMPHQLITGLHNKKDREMCSFIYTGIYIYIYTYIYNTYVFKKST